ncbi:MAG: bifunctional demethylmenaquinone methyltransferase/2-methoxy-6-polyprenyl-1,4-benzoquinol methylase UbiE [Deltaproteobacteria bacterium]|nr:bifunctional demethylmenaquinone methyltransferase/2-methoxy-6-polyprenyl-1,4-benzoquinol methylase UbiE [Deltaproteobacteria bacterium]
MKPYSLHPESIQNLFNNIAPTYDLLNRLLSLRRDLYWRKMAVREFRGYNGWMLDIATGTGDAAIEMIRQEDHERKVFGIDFSEPMIRRAREKLSKKELLRRVGLGLGDALSLPFRENTFSGSMIAFGLRNMAEKEQSLSEMVRVVRPGGKVVILEFTFPQKGLMRRLYPVYFKRILPGIGGLISGDRSAYAYLPESVLHFRYAEEYEGLMRKSGLANVLSRPLTGGVASIISGMKKD